jgi:hypothetical protein
LTFHREHTRPGFRDLGDDRKHDDRALDGHAPAERPGHFIASALLYDPTTGTFSGTGAMNTARAGQLAVLLESGQVLVGGGNKVVTSGVLGSAELYQP